MFVGLDERISVVAVFFLDKKIQVENLESVYQ